MTDTEGWVRIERDFDAPIDAVWEMWTDPGLFQRWYGPMGMSVPVAEMDLRVGGTRRICMEMPRPDGPMRMWFTGAFKDVEPPRRLVYTEAMCDVDGTLISPASIGMPAGTPDITEVILELSETESGTRMVMIHVGVPEGSAGAGGWQQAFDKLSDVLG